MTGGILLTGGTSARMGVDKATLLVGGVTLAERVGELLAAAVALAVEVGRGTSHLATTLEQPPGAGPLAAVAAGHAALVERGLGADVPCLVVACDLPLLSAAVLDRLVAYAGHWSVLPVIDGHAQPLCARWSAEDLAAAPLALAAGERSLRGLPDRRQAVLLDEAYWGADAGCFLDVDAPSDLRRLGLAAPDGSP
ncbi:MAG TPA: NTP transferase domain-containing protein [Acidimicrobiales bacterium]|nr:NTP transferase domain-containing protein [Acidimicrobiales bacterium]